MTGMGNKTPTGGKIEVPIESSSSSSEDPTSPSPQKNKNGSKPEIAVAKLPETGHPPQSSSSGESLSKSPPKASTVKKTIDKPKERSKQRDRCAGPRRSSSRYRGGRRDHHREHRERPYPSGHQRSGGLLEDLLPLPGRTTRSHRDTPSRFWCTSGSTSSWYPRASNAQPHHGSTPQDDRVYVGRVTLEIEQAIAPRPEFTNARDNDTRRAARIFATSGILSLSELRQTPKTKSRFPHRWSSEERVYLPSVGVCSSTVWRFPSLTRKPSGNQEIEIEDVCIPREIRSYKPDLSDLSSLWRPDQAMVNISPNETARAAAVAPAYVPYPNPDLAKNGGFLTKLR